MLRKKGLSAWTPFGVGVAFVMIMALSVGGYLTILHDRVGALTAMHPNDEALGGYKSHAEFEQECTHCHGPIHCIIDESCQNCHMDVAEQRAEAMGLHGLLPSTARCTSCHTDHKGRDAQITVFAFNNIDHALLADFSLAQHQTNYDDQPFTCESCHQLGQFGSEALDCVSCHLDHAPDYMAEHQNQYGNDCLVCHNGHDSLASFNHDQHFVLAGAHVVAACEDCHREQVYVGTSPACESCHPEPEIHAGQFGLACERCHSDMAWLPAQLTEHTFPLAHGSDIQQTCETCHLTSYTEYPCEVCHDYAEMQMAHPEIGDAELSGCLACHPAGLVETTAVLTSN